jgi:predicted Holliday junction resolvase-like endonuclease
MASSGGLSAAALGSQMETSSNIKSSANAQASAKPWYQRLRSTEEEKQLKKQMREARRDALQKSEPQR